MKKPWSVTTTVRNPERLIGFLKVLSLINSETWDAVTQSKYQILLIQHREYGYGNTQFYNGLPRGTVNLIDNSSKDIPYHLAEEVFKLKNYEDPPMRGRQSINPLKKLGFVFIEKERIVITELGKKVISGEIDIGDAFLRCFLKWQIPNPASNDYSYAAGYNTNPFVSTIHFINRVNAMEKERGNKPVGLSKREFALFVPSLISYNNVDDYVNKVRVFRDLQVGLNKTERKEARDKFRYEFAKEFLGTDKVNVIEQFLDNLADYGDNAIRYFRLTKLFCVRGNGFYVDIEPRRKVEVGEILKSFTGEAIKFTSREEYVRYISEYDLPKLPWEYRTKKLEIINLITEEITEYENNLGISKSLAESVESFSDNELDEYILLLRDKRSRLQEQLRQNESQANKNIEGYIDILVNIFSFEDRPIMLEKFVTLGLYALNDAISIKPNYPVGDDNEPTFTAPAGVPDIECYYDSFNAICEVTMLNRRDQWYNEGQPVMRHLRDFENRVKSAGTDTYCLFIAPSIHRDTLNTFWNANKYEYEGVRQKIIPITISQFVKILGVLLLLKKANRKFSHNDLLTMYDSIVDAVFNITSSAEWLISIARKVDMWISNLEK
jgi:hypothetical protein